MSDIKKDNLKNINQHFLLLPLKLPFKMSQSVNEAEKEMNYEV